MPKIQNNGLLSWLVTRPIMFAIIAFILMTGASAIAGLIGGRMVGVLANTLGIIALLGATTWLVRKLPAGNLDRRSFIAINNAQTFITSIVFIISTFIIYYNAQNIMLRMLLLESHSKPSFIAIIIALALFYLYLLGIFIGNLYAKYRRIRAMGVGMWKTLATAPFGFCMLWLPGYLMEEPASKSTPSNSNGSYNRLTNWIMARPAHAAATLVLLIIMAGFTFGFNAILLTLGLGAVFAIWCAIVGTNKMRNSLNGIYSTTAIVINVLIIAGIIGYVAIARTHHNGHFETPEMVQYIDTVQQQ